MRRLLRIAPTLVAAALLAAAAPGEPNGDLAPESPQALLHRAFDNLYGDDYLQRVLFTIASRSSRPVEQRLQIARKQSARPGKALVRFLDPPGVRRTSILILEHDDGSDDFYVYLPAFRKTRHLSSAQRADAFFGTDLSYEDVEPKTATEWEAVLVAYEEFAGRPCAKLEITPGPDFDSVYDRMVSCIELERGIILWTDFYRAGRLEKRLRTNPDRVEQIGGRHIPFEMTFETPRYRSKTLVSVESHEIRDDLPDRLFTTRNLETGDADADRAAAGS